MELINLPKEVLGKGSFKTLPAKEKEEYLSNLLKKILELNPDGVRIAQVKEATGFTYSTIWHHLELLCTSAQGRKISHGTLDIYYTTGIIAPIGNYSKGNVGYTVGTCENSDGNFVCIHEKRKNRLGNNKITRGIPLPIELIDDFVKAIQKAKKQSKK